MLNGVGVNKPPTLHSAIVAGKKRLSSSLQGILRTT